MLRPKSKPSKPFQWPLFIQPDEGAFLVKCVASLAESNGERRIFLGILCRAYEDVLDLEALYNQLPEVMLGEVKAAPSFLSRLSRARPPKGTAFQTLRPASLIRPELLVLFAQGIRQSLGEKKQDYSKYADALRRLWAGTQTLNRLYGGALDMEGGRDKALLPWELRLFARDNGLKGGDGFYPDDQWPDGGWNPNRGGGWPPPPSDIPIEWPDDIPDHPHDYDYQLEPCLDSAIDAIGAGAGGDRYTYATGITSIDPSTVCANENVTIHGAGFGPTQPADVQVIVGTDVAPIVSWSDTEIVFTTTAEMNSACVGFINRSDESLAHLIRGGEARRMSVLEGVVSRCVGRAAHVYIAEPLPQSAPCTGSNAITVGRPVIEFFHANGGDNIAVEPETEVVLTFRVSNATQIRIQRVSSEGPELDTTNPDTNVISLGAFETPRPVNAMYRLTASNRCSGATEAKVLIQQVRFPRLEIRGIEVVQSIQRFNLSDSSDQNTVRLVAGKRTAVRVYVASGISDGFNSGLHPNWQSSVTGSVTVFSDAAPAGTDAGAPITIDPTGIIRIDAPPAEEIDRSNLRHSLIFELPLASLEGMVRIEAKAWVLGRESETAPGWHAPPVSVELRFERRRTITIQPVLITDRRRGLPAPSFDDFKETLKYAIAAFPIAEVEGFHVKNPINLSTNHDLDSDWGWTQAITDLAITALGSAESEEIWAGLVPNRSEYANGGISGYTDLCHDIASVCIAKANQGQALSHELGHMFCVNHAPCGLSFGDIPDHRLPARIEDQGMNVPERKFIESGRPEMMTYCGGGQGWISIALWDIIYDFLSPG